jgi:hypothetical protein
MICFLIILFLGWAVPAGANEEEPLFEKITLTSKWDSVAGFDSTLGFRVAGGWKWIDTRISTVLRIPNDDDGYSGCSLGVRFPQLSPDLRLNTSYQWNEKYRIFSSGLDYRFHPWKKTALKCDYLAGKRDALPEGHNNYLYFLNRANVEFDWKPNRFGYGLQYTYTSKNYSNYTRYTSGRQLFSQKIIWPLTQESRISVRYVEESGEFPYDMDYSLSYWKMAWTIKGEHRLTQDFRWNWEYYQMEKDQSRQRKRLNQQFKTKWIWQPDPSSRLSAELSLAEKIYTADINYDPDDAKEDPYDDPSSRTARKFTIQYCREWKKLSFELGLNAEWRDYYANDSKDGLYTGFHGSLVLNAGDFRFTFKALPLGDLYSSLPNYQLKLVYVP